MKKAIWSLAALAGALAAAGGASAQVCAGFPITKGQGTVGALVNFPSGFHQVGAEGSYHSESSIGLNGGVLSSWDSNSTLITFRGGLAFDLAGTGGLPAGLSVCPVVRADFSTRSGLTLWQVPLGVGVGATVPVGSPGTTLTPYVIPALMWEKLSGAGSSHITETHFALRGGADLNVSRFFLGGRLEWIDAPGVDAVFGVRAGMKF
jgi:hypothetical protein